MPGDLIAMHGRFSAFRDELSPNHGSNSSKLSLVSFLIDPADYHKMGELSFEVQVVIFGS